MKMWNLACIDALVGNYATIGGDVVTLEEGVLGYGLTVCFADGYKVAVIKERPLNTQSSGHTVRFYNEMPKKYQEMIDRLEEAV